MTNSIAMPGQPRLCTRHFSQSIHPTPAQAGISSIQSANSSSEVGKVRGPSPRLARTQFSSPARRFGVEASGSPSTNTRQTYGKPASETRPDAASNTTPACLFHAFRHSSCFIRQTRSPSRLRTPLAQSRGRFCIGTCRALWRRATPSIAQRKPLDDDRWVKSSRGSRRPSCVAADVCWRRAAGSLTDR